MDKSEDDDENRSSYDTYRVTHGPCRSILLGATMLYGSKFAELA